MTVAGYLEYYRRCFGRLNDFMASLNAVIRNVRPTSIGYLIARRRYGSKASTTWPCFPYWINFPLEYKMHDLSIQL